MRLILTLFIVSLTANLSAKEVYHPNEAHQLLQHAKVDVQLTSLKRFNTLEIIDYSRALLASNEHSNLSKEFLLFQATRAISELPPSTELKQLLNNLAAFDSHVYWQTSHVGRVKEMLAYPIAGTAEGILNDWQLSQQSALLSSNGAVDFAALEQFFIGEQSSDKAHIFQRYLTKATANDIAAIASWANANSHLLTLKQQLALAAEASDVSLASTAFAQLQSQTSASGDTIRALSKLANRIPVAEAMSLYKDLLQSPAYGSVAVHLIHQSDIASAEVEQVLIAVLGHKTIGGDAAFALSQRMSATLINTLVDKLADENHIIAKRAELALSLASDPSAKRALEDFKHSLAGQGAGQ